jgi:hypothetical protein
MRKGTHTGIRVRKRKRDLWSEDGVDRRNEVCEGFNGHTHRGFNYFALLSVDAWPKGEASCMPPGRVTGVLVY